MEKVNGRSQTWPGAPELLADADRPGGWLLTVDGIRQSYVDLDDPRYLDFEYVQAFADILDALPPGPLAVTHVGGAGCTLARYIAAVRPGSPQIVLEPDAELTALVRARLPLPRGSRIRIRAVDGRVGMARLADGSADAVVVDAFHDGCVPGALTTREYFGDVARVLQAHGVALINIADGPPVDYTRRLVATLSCHFRNVLAVADSGVLKGRRFGNVVLAASRRALPTPAIRRAAARAAFPRTVHADVDLRSFAEGARPLTDGEPVPSPRPPDEIWKVG